jgi:hypothetical protein
MKKKILTFIIILFFAVNVNSESVDVRHFLLCPSVNGVSGFAYIPSAYVLPSNVLSLGLHKFEFEANYGLFEIFEAGLYFDFSYSSNLMDVIKAGRFNVKFHFLNEDPYFVSLAAGMKQCPLNVFDKIQDEDFNLYFVASKKINNANLTIGIERNLTGLDEKITDVGFISAISLVIYDTILFVTEYERNICNVGFKISMNSNITIDFFIKDIGRIGMTNSFGDFLENYFIFGIDYIQ